MGAKASSFHRDSIYEFTVKDPEGKDVDLSIYRGKMLLVVNVASKCMLTNNNYEELNALYFNYRDQGLEILGFPCNQFNGQEPGTNEQIVQRACTVFKSEFPIFGKVEVNGKNTAPVYKFLKSSKPAMFNGWIVWNFTKFLVDKEGHVVRRYSPTTDYSYIENDIKKLVLGNSNSGYQSEYGDTPRSQLL